MCIYVRVCFILFFSFFFKLWIRAPLAESLYANEEQEIKTTGEQFGLVNITMMNFEALEETLS